MYCHACIIKFIIYSLVSLCIVIYDQLVSYYNYAEVHIFITSCIKELPGDRRTSYHDQEEGERMHSVCFYTSYKAS